MAVEYTKGWNLGVSLGLEIVVKNYQHTGINKDDSLEETTNR